MMVSFFLAENPDPVQHPLAGLDRFLAIEQAEIIDAVQDAFGILVFDFHLHTVLGADCQIDGLKTLLEETGQRTILADGCIQLHLPT